MSDRCTIRIASSADAAALARLADIAFRAAFAADNTPEDIEAYVQEAFSTDRVAHELANPDHLFLLAFADGMERPAGYAKLRSPSTDPSVTGTRAIELERLYADPEAIGRGIGSALMRATLQHAAAAGHETLWLGVWERNARAIAFYERWGFETVGSHAFRLGSDDQTDLVMQRSVLGGSGPILRS